MFNRFYINNFKSLRNFEIYLSSLTALVGDNSVGKSTFLQAMDFMIKSVQEDFDVILERQGLKLNDILSKYTNDDKVMLECDVTVKEHNIRWTILLRYDEMASKTMLLEESIEDIDSGETLLDYVSGNRFLIKSGLTQLSIQGVKAYSSVLKMVDVSEVDNRLKAFRNNILKTKIYDVLEPKYMKVMSEKSLQNTNEDKLPALIKSLNKNQRQLFNVYIEKIMRERFSEFSVFRDIYKKEVLVKAKEKNDKAEINITSNEMSYGIIRLFSVISILCSCGKNSVLAFDEIENGINSLYAGQLVEIFYEFVKKNDAQFIFSTQNEYFIDFVNKYDIVYFYRYGEKGTRTVKIFDIPEINDKTEYMYPGEVLLNLDQNELMRIIKDAEG